MLLLLSRLDTHRRTRSRFGLALVSLTLLATAVGGATAAHDETAAFSANEIDAAPVWSPDGTRLLFSNQNTAGHWQISVIDANGAGRRLLVHGNLDYVDVAWSPNGKQIGYSGQTSSQVITAGHVFVANAQGGGQDALTTGTGWYDALFGWSPTAPRLPSTASRTVSRRSTR